VSAGVDVIKPSLLPKGRCYDETLTIVQPRDIYLCVMGDLYLPAAILRLRAERFPLGQGSFPEAICPAPAFSPRSRAFAPGIFFVLAQETTVQDKLSPSESLTFPTPLTDTIRVGLHRATPADATAVRDLTRAAYARWVPVIGREPRPMNADYDLAVRDHMVDLLHLGSELAALIEMRPEVDHLLIVNVAVSPAHQGNGYGRALLSHAEELARSLGLKEVRLYTNGSFSDNIKLYKHVGYRVDREEVHPQFGATVYMSKRLLPVLTASPD
jgi:ribosomal protein S18 acetylase RimI-like enzyme